MKWLALLLMGLAFAGCASHRTDAVPSTSQGNAETAYVMARGDDAERSGRVDYWLAQGPSIVVEASDFDSLFLGCEEAARDFLFRIDRSDRRSGRIITMPMTSAQFFEFLRRDVRTAHDLALSSIATYRRTLVFEIGRNDRDQFEAVPKVVVERLSRTERRITSVVLYRGVFGRRTASREVARGSRESDAGVRLPEEYWYAVGRDAALERAVADRVRARVTSSVASVRQASAR